MSVQAKNRSAGQTKLPVGIELEEPVKRASKRRRQPHVKGDADSSPTRATKGPRDADGGDRPTDAATGLKLLLVFLLPLVALCVWAGVSS